MQRLRRAIWAALLLLAVSQNGFAQLLTFNIQAQKLADALGEFAQASGAEVFFSPDITAGLSSQALVGQFSTHDALMQLLRGTGLEFVHVRQQAYAIRPAPRVVPASVTVAEAVPPKIEEIIVTSQRRSQSIYKVPISITGITRELLKDINVADVSELSSHVPGLFITEFSVGQPLIRMRGIGSSDDGAGNDIPVALYVDDVHMGRMTNVNVALFDVERIEVLRGPQGTLFGRNASAGAIHITTPSPTAQTERNFTLELGNLDHRLVKGDMSGELFTENLLGRLAFIHDYTAGYQENLFTGDEQQGGGTTAMRSKLQYRHRDALSLQLAADYSVDNLDGTGRIPVDQNHPSWKIFNVNGGSVRKALNGDKGFSDRRNYGVAGTLKMDLDDVQFTAISAWRRASFDFREDSTGLNLSINNPVAVEGIASATSVEVTDNVFDTTRQFTQEFRLTSASEQTVPWVLGVYYLQQSIDRLEIFEFNALNVAEQTLQENNTKSLSVYGDISFPLRPGVNLTAGLRRSFERKDITQSAIAGEVLFEETYQVVADETWSNTSYRLVLDYSPSDDLMFYGSIATGFRSGGFQGQAPNAVVAQTPFDEETVTSRELGAKFRSQEGRFSLNTSFFHADYSDLQTTSFSGIDVSELQGFFFTSNAAESRLSGYELEFSLKLTSAFEVSGSYMRNRGEYREFIDASGYDRRGTAMGGFPESTSSLAAIYHHHFAGGGDLRLRLDRRYQGVAYRSYPRSAADSLRAYNTFSASVDYSPSQQNWEMGFWVKNLTDELYQDHGYFIDASYAVYAPPRTFGLSFSWHYSP